MATTPSIDVTVSFDKALHDNLRELLKAYSEKTKLTVTDITLDPVRHFGTEHAVDYVVEITTEKRV